MEAYINVYERTGGRITTGDVFYSEEDALETHERKGLRYIKTVRLL